MTLRLRAALAGVFALSAYACAAEPAPAAGQASQAAPAARTAPRPASDAPAPAGFEVLEVVTQNGRTRFFVEIADEEPERQRGLMYRKVMPPARRFSR